jgi:hypothetical protein
MTALSEQQIRTAFEACVGLPSREADVQLVLLLGATSEALAEYIWDHWLGEPEQPTLEDLRTKIESLLRPRVIR